MKSKSVSTAYQSIKKFSEISGVLNNPDYDTVDLYNSLGFEELSESITALEENNPVEVLDGCIDEFYIVCGKMAILEKMGFNVEEALRRVCENNLSKFPDISNNKTNVWPPEYEAMINKKHQVLVLKNKAGKVVKPPGFKPVYLSDLVPGGS